MTMEKTPENIQKIQEMLNSGHAKEAIKKMDQQAKAALLELERNMMDLAAQVLGFMPSKKQRAKYGGMKHLDGGGFVLVWDDIPFLKLTAIRSEIVNVRVGDNPLQVKFAQDYEILKDDPIGYKARNPKDNYVHNHYTIHESDDDETDNIKLIKP